MSGYWDSIIRKRTLTRRRALGVAGGGLAGAFLLACGSDSGDSTPAASSELEIGEGSIYPSGGSQALFTPSDGPPQRGGTFVDRYTSMAGWNPVSNEPEGRHTGARYAWDRLLTSREGERRYNLEAAATVETPDPLQIVFKLKPNQFFHDIPPVNGRALKASDIVASQEYVRNLSNAFDKLFATDFLERAEAPDDLTVVYRLKKPAAYLFSSAMLGSGTGQNIMAPESFERLNTQINAGTGPWYYDSSSQLSIRHVLKRHPKFREANLPHIDQVDIMFLPDAQATEAAFRAGQIDRWVSPSPTQITTIPQEMGDKARLVGLRGWQSYSANLNMDKPSVSFFRDVRVREAFWRLTNREQFLDLVWQDLGQVPVGIVGAGHTQWQLESSQVAQYYAEDVAKARQLLSAANFDLGKEIELYGGLPASTGDQGAQVWQQQLSRAGVKTRISNVSGSAEQFQKWGDNDWEMMIQGSPGTEAPGQTIRNLHTRGWSDVYRRFGLHDTEIDALIEKSESELDIEENIRQVKDVQLKAIQRFSSFNQLISPTYYVLYSGRVQQIELTQVLPVYQTNMWLKQG